MPCSGLNSATTVTPGALRSRSMVGLPERSMPVWLVIRPMRRPRNGAQQHARVAGQVVRGGEEAGVARHPAHAAGGGVVDDASQHDAVLVWFGGRDAGGWPLAVGCWAEHRVVHPQRLEHFFFREL